MNAVLVVAHPDDCVIFAWPCIKYKSAWNWRIVYLTYNKHDARAQEASAFWDSQGISTEFLGFEDHYRDLEQGEITTFNKTVAKTRLHMAIDTADVILTHNPDGDYGHIHHQFVNACVVELNIPAIYFASTHNCDTVIKDQPTFDISMWPLHKEVIEGFQDRHIGRYYTKRVKAAGLWV